MGRNISSTLCVIIMLLCFACANSFTYGQSMSSSTGATSPSSPTPKPQRTSAKLDPKLEKLLREDIATLKMQLERVEIANKNVCTANDNVRAANARLQKENAELKKRLAVQQKSPAKQDDQKKSGSSDLQAKVEALTSENSKLRKELQVIRQTRVALAKEIEMLNEKVKTYEQTLNQIRGLAK